MAASCDVTDGDGREKGLFLGWEIIAASLSTGVAISMCIMRSFISLA
jgi:hypothetical protein